MNFVRKQRQGLRLIHLDGSEEIVFMRPPGMPRPGGLEKYLGGSPSDTFDVQAVCLSSSTARQLADALRIFSLQPKGRRGFQ